MEFVEFGTCDGCRGIVFCYYYCYGNMTRTWMLCDRDCEHLPTLLLALVMDIISMFLSCGLGKQMLRLIQLKRRGIHKQSLVIGSSLNF